MEYIEQLRVTAGRCGAARLMTRLPDLVFPAGAGGPGQERGNVARLYPSGDSNGADTVTNSDISESHTDTEFFQSTFFRKKLLKSKHQLGLHNT